MTDRPIIMSAPMVRASLREIAEPGTGKTETRRILSPATSLFNGRSWTKLQKAQTWNWNEAWVDPGPSPAGNPGPYLHLPWLSGNSDPYEGTVHRIYPKVRPGDRLWVRETCAAVETHDDYDGVRYEADQKWVVIESTDEAADRWIVLHHYGKKRGALVPAIHMPRWASRLTLLVTATKIERLQDISERAAINEGATRLAMDDEGRFYEHAFGTHRCGFIGLWIHLHNKDSWDANPVVLAITFKPVLENVDRMREAA